MDFYKLTDGTKLEFEIKVLLEKQIKVLEEIKNKLNSLVSQDTKEFDNVLPKKGGVKSGNKSNNTKR